MKRKVHALDVVELRNARGSQPAGTAGTVIELFATEALIEVADEKGATIELLNVPYEELRVRSPEPARRRAAG